MKSSKPFTILLSVALTVLIGVFVVSADTWERPSQEPPLANTAAPINTGDKEQSKEGRLIVGTGTGIAAGQTGLSILKGNLTIGTAGTALSAFGVGMNGGIAINGTNATQMTIGRDGVTAFALNSGINDPDAVAEGTYNPGGAWTMYDKHGGGWNASLTSSGGDLYTGKSLVVADSIYLAEGNGHDVYADDFYIRSIGKWASQLSATPPPVVATSRTCAGVVYEPAEAYCDAGVLRSAGYWLPLQWHELQQNDPDYSWAALQQKEVTVPSKICKLKADTYFDDGGFVSVFAGITGNDEGGDYTTFTNAPRIAYWDRNFILDSNTPYLERQNVKDSGNNVCGEITETVSVPAVDWEGYQIFDWENGGVPVYTTQTQYRYNTVTPYINGSGNAAWCGNVLRSGAGGGIVKEYGVNLPAGSAIRIYSTHAIGKLTDKHSYTVYGELCF